MSSFLFEKQSINCACFETSPQSIRRIFRSQSEVSTGNKAKSSNETPVKIQTPKPKHKKKSLKKQTAIDPLFSPKVTPVSNKILQETFSPEIKNKNDKKQHILTDYQPFQTGKSDKVLTQRSKIVQNLNIINFPSSFQPQQFILPSISKSHNYNYSHHLIAQNKNQQYHNLVQQEFKNDLNDYKRKMQVNQHHMNLDQQKLKIIHQTHPSQAPFPSIITSNRVFQQLNTFKIGQLSTKQILSSQQQQPYKNQTKKQEFSHKNHSFERAGSLQLIPQQKILLKSLYDLSQGPVQKKRKESFTNSTILYKQKELQDRKFKYKMYAKEIESQKDGSSSNQSDKISEVVGRGWDGLTEQKQELQELDDLLMRKESKRSQTILTQESHIKNSEIKTLTDFSNSFISPKSQKTKLMQTSTAFGGGNYAMGSISYQNIDDLQRLKKSGYGKLHF